jgi:ketosteroid isomerase-like protein
VTALLKILDGLLVVEVFEIHDYFQSGDKVVALGHQGGQVRTKNQPYQFDIVHV